jgi:prepilin peptidase CpaA
MNGIWFAWIALGIAAIGAAFDLRQGRIPNLLTRGVLLLAPFAHAAWAMDRLHDPYEAFVAAGLSLSGAALCAAVPALLWRLGAIGGGDVKLVASVGALAGLSLGIEATFYAFFFGTAFALLHLAWRGTLLRSLADAALVVIRTVLPERQNSGLRKEPAESFRLGPAICAGVAWTMLLHGGLS